MFYHKLIELAPNKSQKLMVNRKIKKVKTSILKKYRHELLDRQGEKELIFKDCHKRLKGLEIGAL